MSIQNSSTGTNGDLGRVIFERKASKAEYWMGGILAVVFVVVATGFLFASTKNPRDKVVWPSLGYGGAVIVGVLIYAASKKLFRCHERGVYNRTIFGTRSLRYEDLEAFRYSAVRKFQNGVYQGTEYNFHFEPKPVLGGKPLRYVVTLKKDDNDLDRLRDSVSKLIASRWVNQIKAGQSVAWTPNLTFVRGGIEYIAQGFVGKKPPVVIPYQSIERHAIETGNLYIWLRGEKKPAITENVGARNFFPGYLLFQSIVKV